MTSAESELYGRTPVGRMFLKCALPGMVSGLVWALCSIVDGIFVGNYLGSEALAAVNLAWPIMTVAMAVSDMIAAGSSVRISMHLGSGDLDSARRVFTGSVKIIVAISCVFLAVGLLLGGPIVSAMGAGGVVADTAAQYIAVFCLFAPLGLLFFATDNYLRICGMVNLSMWINVGVTVMNIALLALLIGWAGCGAWASAFATGASICAGSVASLVPFIRKKTALRFVGGWMDLRTTGRVAYNGISTFFNSVSGSLFMIVANSVLLAVSGDAGVAAYGIIMYVNSVLLSLFNGMNSAMQPALSYNHGSGNGRRVGSISAVMSVASLTLGIVSTLVCVSADDQLVSVFLGESDAAVAALASDGLSVFAFTYLMAWVYLNVNQILAATDMPAHALVVGVLSQFVLPVAFLLPMSSSGIDGVWWSMVAASAASMVMSIAALGLGVRNGIFGEKEPAADAAG